MRFNLKGLSLSSRILIQIISVSLVLVASLVLLNALKNKKAAYIKAKELVESKSRVYADINRYEFEKVSNTLKNIVSTYQGYAKITAADRRIFFIQSLKNVIDKNPEFISIGMIWEPDAPDGIDSGYVNAEGCSKTGRFIPLINRSNSNNLVQESINFETAIWYNTTKIYLQAFITEPQFKNVNNKESIVSIFTQPIITEGIYKGLLYAEVSFENLMSLNDQLKIFKSGYGQLISNTGQILSHPDKKYLNKTLEDYKEKNIEVINTLNTGINYFAVNISSSTNKRVFKSISPVKIENLEKPLYFVVVVPYSEVYHSFNSNFYQSIFIGLLGLLLLVIISFFITKRLTKITRTFTRSIEVIASSGAIDKSKKIVVESHDDFRNMADAINRLVDELNTKTAFANEIKNGNLNTSYSPLSNKDILGASLVEIRQSLIKSAEDETIRKSEDEKRTWAAEGLTRFAEILRKNNDNINVLSYEVIKNLVKYVKANQGGVFLINDNDTKEPYLELTACFAYDRQKFLDKKILPGEGLVGTCYLEKKSVFLTKVPKNYVNITSGLGDSNPSSLLIVPLKLNEENYGVIELASFENIEQYQVEFIEKVSEIIASTISSVKINMKTATLLEQSQEQAEEMKAQEEEMRQNMEELTATQESLAEKDSIKQKEIERLSLLLEEKANEINKTEEENKQKTEALYLELQKYQKKDLISTYIEPKEENKPDLIDLQNKNLPTIIISAELIISSFNENFLVLVKHLTKDLKAKHISEIFNSIENQASLISDIMASFKKKNYHSADLFIKTAANTDSWFKAVFYPVDHYTSKHESIIVSFFENTEEISIKNGLLKKIDELTINIKQIRQEKTAEAVNENLKEKQSNISDKITELLGKAFITEEYFNDGEIVHVNNLFENTYGYKKSDVVGKNIISLIPDSSRKEFKMIWDSILRGNIFKGETCRLSKTGKEIWFNSMYFTILDDSKKIKKIVFLAIDNSEKNKMELLNQEQAEKIKEYENELKKVRSQPKIQTKDSSKNKKN
jgi:methyl-accepting chemotaxis protein